VKIVADRGWAASGVYLSLLVRGRDLSDTSRDVFSSHLSGEVRLMLVNDKRSI
jgi:hypothetical protein